MPQPKRMEVNGSHTLLAYAEDIVIAGDLKQDVTNSISSLIKMGRYVGMSVNEKKTNCIICTRQETHDNMKTSQIWK